MSDKNGQPQSDWNDELGMGKRINFRDYPSTGWVVLAALVSGLSWLAYKRSRGKREGQSMPPDVPQQTDKVALNTSLPADEDASAEPKRNVP